MFQVLVYLYVVSLNPMDMSVLTKSMFYGINGLFEHILSVHPSGFSTLGDVKNSN